MSRRQGSSASTSKFNDLYKARREGTTLDSRRLNKGNQRKAQRDDVVNKRRQLDMSPVQDDESTGTAASESIHLNLNPAAESGTHVTYLF